MKRVMLPELIRAGEDRFKAEYFKDNKIAPVPSFLNKKFKKLAAQEPAFYLFGNTKTREFEIIKSFTCMGMGWGEQFRRCCTEKNKIDLDEIIDSMYMIFAEIFNGKIHCATILLEYYYRGFSCGFYEEGSINLPEYSRNFDDFLEKIITNRDNIKIDETIDKIYDTVIKDDFLLKLNKDFEKVIKYCIACGVIKGTKAIKEIDAEDITEEYLVNSYILKQYFLSLKEIGYPNISSIEYFFEYFYAGFRQSFNNI